MFDRDIFGNEVLPADERRGRPKHQPTENSRTVVSVLASMHKRVGEIAAALNISEPTLRKRYRHELDHGRDQIRAEVKFRLMEQVRGGNVSAMNLMLRELDRADLEEARRTFDGAEPPEPGKKEAAAAAALTAGAGTDWEGDLAFDGEAKHH